jgi:putative oxygen-independent coproporphyrinogen III oxidase
MPACLDWKNSGFGIYIHWPFCQSKCPYCDFNSHVNKEISNIDWKKAYLFELKRYHLETSDRLVNSIFFGGGTPSLMDPSIVSGIVDQIAKLWGLKDNVEISLEANPSSVESQKFLDFKAAGVNRVSIGVQALNDKDLKKLGRLHSVNDALKAISIGHKVFNKTSFDLIYARQEQTINEWRNELKLALSFEPDHLSLYQLTIEPNTAFGKLFKNGKLLGLPKENVSSELYHITEEICSSNGLLPYEISNYSKQNHQSIHNKIYWNYGDYIGVGPGAHGRITTSLGRYATQSHSNPAKWLSHAHEKSGESLRTCLSKKDQAEEMVMMGLRLNSGISKNRYHLLSGKTFNEKNLTNLINDDLVLIERGYIKATQNGKAVLNSLILNLLLN